MNEMSQKIKHEWITYLLPLNKLTERNTSALVVERLELGKLFDEWYGLHPR